MTEKEFQNNAKGADSCRRLSTEPRGQDFWARYVRGLRRNYHGEKFGTEEDHNLWMSAELSKDDSRRMIRAGASSVIGLDILLERFIGLETADIFLERDDLYFERILGDMNNLPLRPGTFDIVFMTGTLHHSSDPVHTMHQVAKVLTRDGIAVVINEPVYGLLRSKSLTGCSEVEHGINEHVYRIYEYWGAARRARLQPVLLFPRSIERGLERREPRVAQEMGKTGHAIVSCLWQSNWARRAMRGSALPILYYFTSMPLVMIARKSP